jgi:hypothetical protein
MNRWRRQWIGQEKRIPKTEDRVGRKVQSNDRGPSNIKGTVAPDLIGLKVVWLNGP